jgi:hypothetical protein
VTLARKKLSRVDATPTDLRLGAALEAFQEANRVCSFVRGGLDLRQQLSGPLLRAI